MEAIAGAQAGEVCDTSCMNCCDLGLPAARGWKDRLPLGIEPAGDGGGDEEPWLSAGLVFQRTGVCNSK